MKRRDSERNHPYANEVFSYLNIFDIQGLLKDGDIFKCGVEAYRVNNFDLIRFDLLLQSEEIARHKFCAQLGVNYHIIITSEATGSYQIYDTDYSEGIIHYLLKKSFTKVEFINWWKSNQSFNQKKAMYNAASRISSSIIDIDLVANSLAWGVNIDGFTLNNLTGKVISIYEKRIRTYKPSYSVSNYDPDNFFHGTANRSGDFPSWKILFELATKMNTALLLFTFDTSASKIAGATKIINVSAKGGLDYLNNLKPFNNLFIDNLPGLQSWVSSNL